MPLYLLFRKPEGNYMNEPTMVSPTASTIDPNSVGSPSKQESSGQSGLSSSQSGQISSQSCQQPTQISRGASVNDESVKNKLVLTRKEDVAPNLAIG